MRREYLKALRYLAKVQDGDGKWGNEHISAMTGLSLLAFLGHCEKPTSKEFGPVVRKAIDFLVAMGKNQDGKLSRADGNPWVYEHGIASYALGEAYIFTKEPAIAEVLTPAVARIVEEDRARWREWGLWFHQKDSERYVRQRLANSGAQSSASHRPRTSRH